MAKSKSGKKIMNMVYGLGAAVVIIGALFKIMHWPFGNEMLIVGLVVEAAVFAISAFEPVDNELDDSIEDPVVSNSKEEQGILSQKLDEMLKEAKIDSQLMESLGESIKNFEGAARNIQPTTDSMESQRKYSEELSLAASQMESLNHLYKVQIETSTKQTEENHAVAEHAARLKQQMESLTENLNSLNGVYGGMLTAMRPKA